MKTSLRAFWTFTFLAFSAQYALAQNWKENPAYGAVTLKSGANPNPTLVNLVAGGKIATKLGGVTAWVANPPDARLIYTSGNAALVLRAESEADVTLLVNMPNGSWLANDDGPNTGTNPLLRLPNPPSGQYDIWVGTTKSGHFPKAKLIISEVAREPVKAAERFAVVEIENRTPKTTIRYRVKWSEDAPWSDTVFLKAGRSQTHAHRHDANENVRLPTAQVSFEKGIDVDAGTTTYALDAYPSRSESDGKGYLFILRSGEDTRDSVDLVNRSKAEEEAAFALNAAILRVLANDHKTAAALASRAIALDPTSARAYAIRGRARFMEGDNDGALRDWAHGLRLAPTDTELILFRAEAFEAKKRYERVIDECTRAIEIDPFLAEAYGERGIAHFKMTNYDQAINDSRKAVKMEPQDWRSLTNLGEASLAKGQPLLALDFLNRAIAIHDKNFEPFAARGQVYKALDETAKAALDFQKAQRLGMPLGFAVHYKSAEALAALDAYPLGLFTSSATLKRFNSENFEVDPPYSSKAPAVMSRELQDLVAGEWSRHRAMKFEAVAAVDRFLAAARLTDAERRQKGMTLDWYYGPVTSPVARFRSGDDLGGLRIIGNLKLAGGKELTMIFAVTYYPPAGDKDANGEVGMLFDGDNCRIQARLHATGALENDYLFQSFGANLKDGKMTMRPGFNLDETTGALTPETLTSASLSTRCMHCHNKGFEPSERLVQQLQTQKSKAADEIAKIEGLRKFLELVYVNGGGRQEIKKLETQLVQYGPSSLLPLDELYRANRQYWLEAYPQYLEMRRNPLLYLNPAPRAAGAEPPHLPGMEKR